PLQILIELDALGVDLREAGDFGRVRTAIGFRPHGPAPHRLVLPMEMILQRFEQRVLAEAIAAVGLEASESASALGLGSKMLLAEMPMETLEQRQLQARYRVVIDEVGCPRDLKRRLEL